MARQRVKFFASISGEVKGCTEVLVFITLRPRFKYEKSTHPAGNMVARAGGLQICISAYDKLLLRTVHSAIYLLHRTAAGLPEDAPVVGSKRKSLAQVSVRVSVNVR